jgi:hypothetical protein
MMKVMMATVLAAAALSVFGCSGMQSGGQNLAGFPVDEGCLEFWANSPMFKGNRALAQATNCAGQSGM